MCCANVSDAEVEGNVLGLVDLAHGSKAMNWVRGGAPLVRALAIITVASASVTLVPINTSFRQQTTTSKKL